MKHLWVVAMFGLLPWVSYADIITDKANEMVPEIKAWVQTPMIIEAVKAQNEAHKDIEHNTIQQLDQQWRAETSASDKPLIDKVLSTSLSQHLKEVKESSKGSYTEIIIMDNKGLNVGQSDITSDYWQGDEDKWKKTYLVGPDAVEIGDVDMDESSHSFQSQISVPIVDPETNKVIGAATVGVFVNSLLE